MGCLCTKTTELGVGTFNFEKIDRVHHMPDMEAYEKRKVQEVWRDIVSAGLKETLGLTVFEILFELRPRLVLFFTSALIDPEPEQETDDRIHEEMATNKSSSYSDFKGLVPYTKKQVVWKDETDAKTQNSRKNSKRFSFLSSSSFFSAKQSNKSSNRHDDSISLNQVSDLDRQTDALLAHKNFKAHVNRVVNALSAMINNPKNRETFVNVAFTIQQTDMNLRKKSVQRFFAKEDFQMLIVSIDEALYSLLGAKYLGKRRAMRHLLEILYNRLTYKLPEQSYGKV